MTRILILGGGGMVGQKLAWRLARHGLDGHGDLDVTLCDQQFPDVSAPGTQVTGSITDAEMIAALVGHRPDIVYHLAAIVSGEAEKHFDLGWDVNLSATWSLLEALRAQHEISGGQYRPRVVFTSSIAVFGAPYPAAIDDLFLSAPQTSYGAQKACSELMVADYSRKGFIDGMSLRLPTICVRPGKANGAASSFFSGIIREPLNGQKAVLPVPDSVRHWHASPRAAAGFLTHAAGLDTKALDGRRALNLPGVSCTVREQIDALQRIAGPGVVDLIVPKPDRAVMDIVRTWPENFDPTRAVDLGFVAEASFDEIIKVYLEDDFSGT